MKQLLKISFLLSISLGIASCSLNTYNPFSQGGTSKAGKSTQGMAGHVAGTGNQELTSGGNENTVIAGNFEKSMDQIDKSKLSHALDSPLGKSTHWSNEITGINYTVVPTAKLTIADNPFCRKYTITAARKSSTQQINGTACVGSDGNWQAIN